MLRFSSSVGEMGEKMDVELEIILEWKMKFETMKETSWKSSSDPEENSRAIG